MSGGGGGVAGRQGGSVTGFSGTRRKRPLRGGEVGGAAGRGGGGGGGGASNPGDFHRNLFLCVAPVNCSATTACLRGNRACSLHSSTNCWGCCGQQKRNTREGRGTGWEEEDGRKAPSPVWGPFKCSEFRGMASNWQGLLASEWRAMNGFCA